MSVFRYACRDDAYLFLGAVGVGERRPVSSPSTRSIASSACGRGRTGAVPRCRTSLSPPLTRSAARPRSAAPSASTAAEIHLSALEQVAPPSVVVDERWNVLHVSPTAARFFQQGAGALARRLTELVRPELRDEMHALLQRAMDDPAPQLSAFFPVRFDGTAHRMAVLVQQRPQGDDGRRDMLVTFLDAGPASAEAPGIEQEPSNELVRSLRDKLRAGRAARRRHARRPPS